ncbi:MAG: hypothetical protein M3N51_06205 [Actinomycetota bacterium]|nr:hypothetical protein [Actinomycetota bacterium]
MDKQSHEEFEFVPWSDLVSQPSAERSWLLYLVAGAVAAAVAGGVIARALWQPGPAPISSVSTVPALGATTAPSEVSLPSTVATTAAPLYSEADLMAAPGGSEERWAALRAEWFVQDYFTADAEPSGSTPVRAALPDQATLPQLPHDHPEGGISYVEWTEAYRVEPIGEGLFRVSVAYRSLGGPAEEGLRRLPVQAVAVVVEVGAEGGAAVVDLPSPAVLPTPPDTKVWPEGGEPAPPQVLDAARAEAAAWGEAPEVLSSSASGTGWRVVVTVADPAGTRWPLVLWLDEDGLLSYPPWWE